MSLEDKRQREHMVDGMWLSPQPASILRGDLKKGHVFMQVFFMQVFGSKGSKEIE